jgi:peptidoglycan/xylan/chitin deacetylase (PgdA/CDA1 family)
MRLHARCIAIVFLLAAPAGQGFAAPPGNPAAMCWRPDALMATGAERAIRRDGPGARLHALRAQTMAAEPVPAAFRGSIRRVALPPGLKLIALTFDLCEGYGEVTGYDGGIVDYLRANGIKATFFSGGKWLENHPERTDQLMADPLFELGNHTWNHKNLRKLTGKRLLNEIARAGAAYTRARNRLAARQCMAATPAAMTEVPKQPYLFRFPFGTCSPAALQAVGESGLLAIQWDVVTGDPAPGQTADRIARVVLRRAKPGSIIVAHANGKGLHTAEALSIFIPRLQAKGYRFVTVSELLAAGTPVIADTCYERKPGDNDHY